MKKLLISFIGVFVLNSLNAQEGLIFKNNDTIKVIFNDISLNPNQKLEKFQNKINYFLNNEEISSNANEIDGYKMNFENENFCFDAISGKVGSEDFVKNLVGITTSNKYSKFYLRIFGNKSDTLKAYEYQESSYTGVNYNIDNYFILVNNFNIYIIPKNPKRIKKDLIKAFEDCPKVTKKLKDLKKIETTNEFVQYLNEYKKCEK